MDTRGISGPSPARILVLDDEMSIRALVSQMLVIEGHQVFEARNLSEAREILRYSPVELVLSDIGLPGESGLDLLHELAHRSPDVAVIMMTGDLDTQTAVHCLREGAFDFLLKPFGQQGMISQVVSRVLERQRAMKSERNRIEEQLRVLGKFSSENPNPVLRVAIDGTLLYANDASFAFLDELNVQIGGKLPEHLRHLVTRVLSEERAAVVELESAGRCYSLAVTPIKDADYVYLYGHDISSLKAAEQELTRLKDRAQELALHDPLTGLPNRTLLEERFEHTVAFCERNRTNLVVAFIDLDNFKQINDTQGHKVGDQVLVAVAHQLRRILRKNDTVARWGGDELILLLPGIRKEDARVFCERIKDWVQTHVASENGFFVTMSLGAALYPDDATDPEQLLQLADAALLMVKKKARNGVLFFGECVELKSFRQQSNVRALLSDAVSERRIQVHYQPIIETQTGRTVGAEALARWHEEGHGWLPPCMFIPLAENMGLIENLGRLVQEQALRHLSLCHREGFPLSLSVNVSQRQLLRSGFAIEIVEMVRHFGLNPGQLTLEMTESQALLGLASEAERLEELSRAGFRLSIDDFGQGYSSLASLHEMPVRELKIDMKFVQNLHTQKGRRIVQTIVELSRALGLETVAEGVETQEQMAVLKEFGVPRLQGYLFSKPLPGPEFLALLRNEAAAAALPAGELLPVAAGATM